MQVIQHLNAGMVWRIVLLFVALIILSFKLYESLFTKKGKRPIGKALDNIVPILDRAKPMKWLSFLLGKSIARRIFLTTFLIILLYISIAFLNPRAVQYLFSKGLVTWTSVALLFIVTFISLIVCTYTIAPLIKAERYGKIFLIDILSLGFYFLTIIILDKNPQIIKLITNHNLPLLQDALVFIGCILYGLGLWTSISNAFLIIAFFSVVILLNLITWGIRTLSKMVKWIINKYVVLYAITSTFFLIVEWVVKVIIAF